MSALIKLKDWQYQTHKDTIDKMKLFLYISFAMMLCFALSCKEKDEWSVNAEPVGVMMFDGKEFREGGAYGLYEAYYGELRFVQEGYILYLNYEPKDFTNESSALHASLQFIIKRKANDKFEGGYLYYSKDDDDCSVLLETTSLLRTLVYDVSSAEILVTIIQSTSDTIEGQYIQNAFNFRIDYKMEAIDSKGGSHKVEGWAIHTPNDCRDL